MDQQETATYFLIKDVTVINIHTGAMEPKDILIHNERILNIAPPGALEFPSEARVINAAKQFAIPGLWDSHTHMTAWSAWPGYTHQESSLYIAYGITCVRDVGGQLDEVLALRKHNSQRNIVAPRMWIAGPIIDGKPRILDGIGNVEDAAVEVDTPADAVNMVDSLVEHNVDFLKLYEMLRPEVFKSLMQRAEYHNLPVAGHIPVRMSISDVLEIGQYDMQHLLGGTMSGIKYECVQDRHPMPDRTAILDACAPNERGIDLMNKIVNATDITPEDIDQRKIDSLIQLFVKKGNWHTLTLANRINLQEQGIDPIMKDTLRYLPKKHQAQMLSSRTPSSGIKNIAAGAYELKKNAFRSWHLKLANQMYKAGVKFLAGTEIPGQTVGSNIHLELKALVSAGLSPLEALQTATINPASFFGITHDFGSIEIGKISDMILLEANPIADINNTMRISSVISRGKFFDRESLDLLLKKVADECNRETECITSE